MANPALSRASARVSATVLVEGGGVGEALAIAEHHPDADAHGLGGRERLDVGVVGAHLGVARGDDDLDLLVVAGPADDPVGDVAEVGGRSFGAALMPRSRRWSAR